MASLEFARFRRRVLSDLALREALWAERADEPFVDLALRAGAEHGFAFEAADVHAALAGAGRSVDDGPPPDRPDLLDGFVPVAVHALAGAPVVAWCRLDGQRFAEPFFEETLRVAQRLPFNRAFAPWTPLRELPARGAQRPGVRIAGFVFHLSRCGSTLVAQAFAALPQVLVLSEPPPFDAIVRAHEQQPELDRATQVAWLRAMLDALAQPRAGEQQVVVKLDAWHASHLDLIEAAFPGVPWIFLVREPVDVLVSHRRQYSFMMAALNAPSLLGCTPQEAMRMQPDEYRAQVLGRILTAMVERDAGERTIDYRALPEAIWETIAPRFGIALTAAERARVREATTRDAKAPARTFVSDLAAKRREADEVVQACAARWLRTPYDQLTGG
jgi:gluconate kinase